MSRVERGLLPMGAVAGCPATGLDMTAFAGSPYRAMKALLQRVMAVEVEAAAGSAAVARARLEQTPASSEKGRVRIAPVIEAATPAETVEAPRRGAFVPTLDAVWPALESDLLAIFGNETAGKILLYLQRHGDADCRGIALACDIPLAGIQRQIVRLEAEGVLVSEQRGERRVFQFNPAYGLMGKLVKLLETALLPLPASEASRQFRSCLQGKRVAR